MRVKSNKASIKKINESRQKHRIFDRDQHLFSLNWMVLLRQDGSQDEWRNSDESDSIRGIWDPNQ